MGQICSMVWNAQPHYGKGKKKLFKPVDFMSRKPQRIRPKRDPQKAADAFIDRLDAYQRARDRAKQKRKGR
jgi:hypothetical protein